MPKPKVNSPCGETFHEECFERVVHGFSTKAPQGRGARRGNFSSRSLFSLCCASEG